MFYKVTFWIYFITASLLCTLYLLMKGQDDFLPVILMAFGAGFLIAIVINAVIKFVVHAVLWTINANDYRQRREARRRF